MLDIGLPVAGLRPGGGTGSGCSGEELEAKKFGLALQGFQSGFAELSFVFGQASGLVQISGDGRPGGPACRRST